MKKALYLFLFLFMFGFPALLKADGEEYHIDLKGTLGESTQFELKLHAYGFGSTFVKGETLYTRKNGSVSKIPVYGVWDSDRSGRFSLSEVLNGKVCGTFDFVIESFDEDALWTPLDGKWKFGDKTMKFTDVKYTLITAKYEVEDFQYISFPPSDKLLSSGTYTYNYLGAYERKPVDKRKIELLVEADKTQWSFELQKRDEVESLSAVTEKGSELYNWQAFSIGNAEFYASVFEDAILIYQCNPECVPDGTIPQGFTLEGIYVKEADAIHVFEKRVWEKESDLHSYYDVTIQNPHISDKRLNDSIYSRGLLQDWIATQAKTPGRTPKMQRVHTSSS